MNQNNLFYLVLIFRAITFALLLLANTATAEQFSGIENTDSNASEQQQARIYRNPEERREAGLGRQITDWLQLSGLLEIEQEQTNHYFVDNINFTESNPAIYSLQFGFDATFSDNITMELVLEVENDIQTRSKLDEALISIDLEPLGIEFGRLFVPFGEYYSHFVTGPLLEFGETGGDAIIIDYTFYDSIELAAYLFNSKTDRLGKGNGYDWGLNMEYVSERENIRIGVGYLSDLSESDEKFLSDHNNVYMQQVSAWNAYALIGFYPYEITAEFVTASKPFAEFETNANQPSAKNLEFAYFINPSMQLAFRYESSNKFSDAAMHQAGINWTWRPGDYLLFSIEYLRGKFEDNFVFDDNDNLLNNSDIFAAQVAIEF